ncbi:MAG: hypothetical protein M1819_003391 [Sarea resinae]|nr:MAG: hypothetical protein M1819_003391 [Sarea resinae]
MGWFWGSSSSDDSSSSSSTTTKTTTKTTTTSDPLSGLDPSLRTFLENESPVKYTSNPNSSPSTQQPSYHDQITPSPATSSSSASTTSASSPATGVPPQSLYPDGRYADIWRTYRPLSEVENASKTEQDKLMDVLEGYKNRKAEIGRAALENCALEQWAVNDCFRNGGWRSRVALCRTENREMERCFLMQSKFLKALGYLSTYDRSPDTDEAIQMHADTLYHRMLDQEKAIEEAKANDLPIPTFPPIIPQTAQGETLSPSPSPSATPPSAFSAPTESSPFPSPQTPAPPTTTAPETPDKLTLPSLHPDIQAQLLKRLDGLSPLEREVEEAAISKEIAAGEHLSRQIGAQYAAKEAARKKRRAEGQETVADRVSGWFGW